MITLDMTITLGAIIEAGIFGIGGITTVVTLKSTVSTLKRDMATSKKETREDIAGIQTEIRKLGEVVIKQAAADTRLNAIDDRLAGFEKDIRELRHGEGFIRGQRGIEREYP
jgi:hypothetical protein